MEDIFMRFPGGRSKALTLSYDDGVEQDIKLIEIMNKHGLKGTFNLNSGIFAKEGTVWEKGTIHRRMTQKACEKLYKDSGHEVAVHALTHPHLEWLSSSAVAYEAVADKRNLEQIFGDIIIGMAYPFGTYNDEVVDVLKKCGIKYSRTVKSTERFDIPTDWLRMPATCHHNNPKLMQLADRFINETPNNETWLFYLWGHSYEFESDDNWNVIEKFAEKVGGRDEIWYATNAEIYNYIENYKRLLFSTDMSIVKNPASESLYFERGGKMYEVKAGETLKMI